MKFQKREVKEGSNNLYLKIKDGESVTGLFRGEIFEYRMKWVNNKSVITTDQDPEGKARFKANFILKDETGNLVAKIWEFSTTTYNALADINEEYEVVSTKVKITRRGTGTDTTYSILPLLKEPINNATMKIINDVKLNILENKPKSPDQYGQMPDDEESLPF